MKDTPTAVINGASRGAWRSGLYAMRSIEALTNANTGIVIASVSSSPPMTASTAVSASRPRTETMIVLATRPDSAKTSPWAKLISCRMP